MDNQAMSPVKKKPAANIEMPKKRPAAKMDVIKKPAAKKEKKDDGRCKDHLGKKGGMQVYNYK